jgi:type IV pilus assembly protein PilC
MPLYYWQGITLQGTIVTGYKKARSINDLTQILAKQWIGLMHAAISRATTFVYARTRLLDTTFASLHFLVQAGVRIDKALLLTYNQISHPPLKELLKEVNEEIQQGLSLSQALSYHTDWFDPLTIFLISVGEEAGTLAHVLLKAHQHYHRSMLFQRSLRAALCMPAITLLFFLCIAIALIVGIIPFFADILEAYAATESTSLSTILWLSSAINTHLWLLASSIIAAITTLWYGIYYRTAWYRYLLHLCYKMPFIHHLFLLQELSVFFHALGLLLEQRVSMRHAFKWALQTIHLPTLHNRLAAVLHSIESGAQFAQALHPAHLPFSAEIESFIAIGQESSSLALMCFKSSEYYQQYVDRSLARWNTLIQPLLIIILGALITGLIMLIYSPLLSLSTVQF